ncbi:MAG: hypothetical protein KJZ65_00730 [Phycisphaerales bacterium]|nr:hypothetical protein [Phycisphaerales bacterium]
MSQRMVVFFVLQLILVGRLAAQPTCPFVITSDADFLAATCTYVSGTTWDIDVDLSHSGATATLAIVVNLMDGGVRPSIGNLEISADRTSGSTVNVDLSIQGNLASFNLEDLGSMTLDPEADGNVFLFLLMNGSAGYVECHGIRSGSEIKGDVTEGLHFPFVEGCGGCAASLEYLKIGGDLLGDIRATGRVEVQRLEVTGDIGSASEPVDIWPGPTGGGIGTIQCTNFYGDIGPTVIIRRIQTSGVFDANVETVVVAVPGSGYGIDDPGIFIGSGDFGGLMYVQTQLDGVIHVPGDLLEGGAIDARTLTEDGAIIVDGNVDGDLDSDMDSLHTFNGMPGTIEVGGYLDFPLEISGDLRGSIEVGSWTNAPITVDGDVRQPVPSSSVT